MLVTFWSPVSGQAGNTSNMLSVASVMALDYQISILLSHINRKVTMVEKAFYSIRSEDSIRDELVGIGALERLALSGMLTPESIRDNSEVVISGRMDLLSGVSTGSERDFSKIVMKIVEISSKYQLFFLDVGSGYDNPIASSIINKSDLLVVSLNQNIDMLDRFFKNREFLEGKKVLYCFGKYERKSSTTIDRICKRYKLLKKDVCFIPNNYQFMDAQNNYDILEYLIRAKATKKRFLDFNEDVYFIQNVRIAIKKIMENLALHSYEEVDFNS